MQQRTIQSVIRRRGIVRLGSQATVREACRLMARHGIGAVLVMDSERIAGIFTERDALKQVLAEGRDPERTSVAEVMTHDVVTVGPDTWSLDALRLMSQVGIRHLPVVDHDRVIGIISLRDFVGAELQQAGARWGERGTST